MTQPEPLKTLYLASASPRRAELLAQLDLEFSVINASIDEVVLPNEQALIYVERMAIEKACAGFNSVNCSNSWVVGGDTCIVSNNNILGKPKDAEGAMQMLAALSGTTHLVLSAVAIASPKGLVSAVNQTSVRFKALSQQEIASYVASKEPFGKAGAYAIQGLGAAFIEHIQGSYSGVMGLPLFELNQLLIESHYKK